MKTNWDSLKKLQQGLRSLEEQQTIPLSELMAPSFISACSRFKDLGDLFDSSPFTIATIEDFTAIPDDDWDAYIRQNTNYSSWSDMQQAAVADWTKRKLSLG